MLKKVHVGVHMPEDVSEIISVIVVIDTKRLSEHRGITHEQAA